MTKTNVRVDAAKILTEVILHKKSLDIMLLNIPVYKDPRDNSLLQEICYGCLRWYYRLDKLISLLLQKPIEKTAFVVQGLLLVGLYQLIYLRVPEYAAISETVNAAKKINKAWSAGLINAVLRNFLRNQEKLLAQIETDVSAKYSHQFWFINSIKQAYPESWSEILAANNAYPPMHLRVNLKKISRVHYLQLLKENKIDAQLNQFSNAGITLIKPLDVQQIPGFADGLVTVQDIASQLAAVLLQLQPGQTVLDACAAPGGKLTHILETEPNLAEVIAVEIDNKRIAKIQENLQRLQLHATIICGDASEPDTWFSDAKSNDKLFDRILLDAPCSATGVIRRHSDIKILRTKQDIVKLQHLQLKILNALWQRLKPGGILVYSTCSVLPEENWQNIAEFLKNRTDATEIIIQDNWGIPEKIGRQILPGSNAMDGFYYAVLQKKKITDL